MASRSAVPGPALCALTLVLLLTIGSVNNAQTPHARAIELMPVPAIPYVPRHYVCYRSEPSPVIDGRLDDKCWQQAEWTELFTDIEESLKPAPRFETRAKLLWDSVYFYIGADLREPDVWEP